MKYLLLSMLTLFIVCGVETQAQGLAPDRGLDKYCGTETSVFTPPKGY